MRVFKVLYYELKYFMCNPQNIAVVTIMMIIEIPAPFKFPCSFDIFSPPFKIHSIKIVK